MTLRMMNISDVVDVNPRLPTDLAKELSRDVDFVPMAQLSEQGFVAPNGARALGEVIKGYTYFANGDVIVAKITPCMENGKAAYVDNLPHGVAFGSTEFHVLRPGPEVDGRYLFYMIWNPIFRNTAEANMTGSAGQKRVPAKFFDRFEIPLPPLSEQKRIADILDKADAIRRKRQEIRASDRHLLLSIFDEMFGDPIANTMQWPIDRLDKVIAEGTSVSYGIVQCGPEFEHGVPYIRTSDMTNEILGPLESFGRTDPKIANKFKRSALSTGDLVFANRASIGAIVEVPEYLAGANLTQGTTRISPGPMVNRHYLMWLFRSVSMQRWFDRSAKGATFREITMGRLREAPVPVPPLALQEEFSRRYMAVNRLTQRWDTTLERSATLFDSLVQRAFKGKL